MNNDIEFEGIVYSNSPSEVWTKRGRKPKSIGLPKYQKTDSLILDIHSSRKSIEIFNKMEPWEKEDEDHIKNVHRAEMNLEVFLDELKKRKK